LNIPTEVVKFSTYGSTNYLQYRWFSLQ